MIISTLQLYGSMSMCRDDYRTTPMLHGTTSCYFGSPNHISYRRVRPSSSTDLNSPFFGSSLSTTFRHYASAAGTRRSICFEAIYFQADKSVAIPCQERETSVDEYLSDTQRIVHVVFPDSNRLQYRGEQTWRARLRPVSFFAISATPVCDLRSWFENGALRIFSDRVVLDMAGLPSQFHNVNLKLLLEGQLFAVRGESAAKPQQCTLEGWVRMSLNLDLPYPLSLLPQPAVVGVGNAILDGILSAMQGALMRGLVRDYRQWASERLLLKVRQGKLNAQQSSRVGTPRKAFLND